jgi:hypothetical protein
MKDLITLFKPHCADVETLDELLSLLADHGKWHKAHELFTKIRRKNRDTNALTNARAHVQYRFEEICAKTIYNLSLNSAPFDPDSAYWVVPRALGFAMELGISTDEVVAIVRSK